MSEFTQLRGAPMTDDEIDEFLLEQGFGVLALTDSRNSYAVPMSFGYDGESRLFLYLIRFGEESTKLEYLTQTRTATIVAYDVTSSADWQSVIVRGELYEITPDEHEAFETAIDDNAWFPSLFPSKTEMTGVRRCVMEIAEATGRKGT